MKKEELAELLKTIQLDSSDTRNKLLDEMKVDMDVEKPNGPNSIFHYRDNPILKAAKLPEPQASLNPSDQLSELTGNGDFREELARKLKEMALRTNG